MVHNLQNLNQFQKKFVCWNQHKKLCLHFKFEENLRWWVDWLGQLTWNDPATFELNAADESFSAGVARTKRHISYCITPSSHIIHMGTHEHHPISSSQTHLLTCVLCKCARMCMCLHKPPNILPCNGCEVASPFQGGQLVRRFATYTWINMVFT